MRIRIEGTDLPGSSCGPSPERPGGHDNIHVGVQRRNRPGELLGLVRGDAPSVQWMLDCVAARSGVTAAFDLTGPHIQGRPGGRFIYLSWGVVDSEGGFTLFRRAKLSLEAVPAEVTERALRDGVLVGRLGLRDERGNPVCAAVGPSQIHWSAKPANRPQ